MDSGVDSDSTKTGSVIALENDIVIFETKSKVPIDLDWHVYSSPTTQILWYMELSKAWRILKPKGPKQATKLVYDTLHSIHEYGVHFDDMEGFLHFYGLPHYSLVIKPSPYDQPSWVTLAPASPVGEDKPVFELSTLPVMGKRVTSGVVFVVSVEVKDFYLLPEEILFAGIGYRCDEYLTKKYEIKLRGIRLPKVGARYGDKARDELAKLLDFKCLTILVYYFDEEKRCVGEVYSAENHLQAILLNNAAKLSWGGRPIRSNRA